MKKICCLLFFLLVMASSAFASEFNAKSWYWIGSSSEMTAYVNTDTMKYEPSTDTAEFYVRVTEPAQKYDDVMKATLNFTKKTLTTYDIYRYPFNSSSPQQIYNHDTGDILPDTLGYALYVKVAPMVDRDAKLEEYKKNKQEDEKKAKHKEDVQTRQTYTAGVVGAVIGNLLGRNY